jgi:2-polyprenyl-3-methyl-5-hydroxy-6-metoxy-1,4-benzoquinol methylase
MRNLPDKLREKVSQGYSVLVFPEGTRSADMKIKRFHKGAFLLAEKLGIDILPVFIHGAGDCMTKGENHIRHGSVTLKIYPRIKAPDKSFGSDYHERTKSVLAFYRKEYAALKPEIETPAYLRKKVISNYIFKGPVLEWYTRIKLSLEDNYSFFDSLIPSDAVITDVGCGYGMMSYMLALRSENRIITGIDYDEDKIELADNCLAKNDKINFIAADVLQYTFKQSDVFIVSDVLHYMSAEKREKLLSGCFMSLRNGGMVIIRDADRDISRKHLLTRYTEFFSTSFRFNKTTEKLDFFSKEEIFSLSGKYGMQAEVISRTTAIQMLFI